MKNKYFPVAAVLLFAFYFTTCGNGLPGTEENGGEEQGELKTWTWTERAFALEITGRGDYPRNGDSFTMSHMGYRFSGKISREENTARFAQTIDRGAIAFPRPGGEPPIIAQPVDNEDAALYFEEMRFPGYSKPIKAAVNRDGLIVNVTLPEPVGADEAGGKSYNIGNDKTWRFDYARKTYLVRYSYRDDGVDYEAGSYTWEQETGTLLLLPEKVAMSADTPNADNPLLSKDDVIDVLRAMVSEKGINDDAVVSMTKGRYKTVNAYLIASINQRFGLQVFTYEINDGGISRFTRNLATTLDHDEENKTIGGCPYSVTAATEDGSSIHYRLDMPFEAAKAKFIALLGDDYTSCMIQDGNSIAANGDNWVILEECLPFDSYRLVLPYKEGERSGLSWSRLNIGNSGD